MRKLLLSLAVTTVLGLGFAATPASSGPIGPMLVDVGASQITQVQMTGREMMQRRRAMRQRSMMRQRLMRRSNRMGVPGNPNARDPSRAPRQQNLGQTSGGYRR